MLAYEQAQAALIPEGINHILLCTDGDFNVGPSSTRELVDIIREKRKSGVTLTVLGFGIGNLNDDLMEAVSNAGNGIYGVISGADHARRYVRDKMLSTVVHVAKDMKIQVEFNAQTVKAYRLLGYENRAIADRDFRSDGIDAGEIGAGHRVTALYEVVLAGGAVPVRNGAPVVLDGQAERATAGGQARGPGAGEGPVEGGRGHGGHAGVRGARRAGQPRGRRAARDRPTPTCSGRRRWRRLPRS